jgi:hypothetical protein
MTRRRPASRSPSSSGGPALAARWWALVLVPVLVLVAYGHTLPYDFELDDIQAIRENHALDHPGDVARIWHYHPSRFLLYQSFALNIALTGRSLEGLLIVNIAFHVIAALLVGAIAQTLAGPLMPARSGRSAAARAAIGPIAALLFAVHPIATQAVTYIIQRTASLAALWELLAVWLYLVARSRGHVMIWAGSWLAALLAAFTKEIAVALPLLILAIEVTLRNFAAADRRAAPATSPERHRGPHLAWLAPYLLIWPLVAITASLPSVEQGVPLGGLRETGAISRLTYALTQCVVVPQYLRLVIWPAGQNLDHDVVLHHAVDGPVIAGVAVLALVTLAAWLSRRREPLLWVGWIWFLIALIPESSVFPITDVMFEHRVYMPFAGLSVGVAAWLATFAASGRWRWLLPAAVVATLTAVTHQRNRVWKDEVSLWSDAAAKAPGSARARNNLGIAFEKRGRTAEAEQAYAQVIELAPNDIDGLMNLARLHGMRGSYRDALALQQRAERLMPDAPDILTDLGTTWWALGDTARAAAYFTRAIDIATQRIHTSRKASQVARHASNSLARLRAAPGAGTAAAVPDSLDPR